MYTNDDVYSACVNYERLILGHRGIDLQLLGIGTNGHIGFNEPGTPFDSQTRKVELKEETRLANRRYFHRLEDVPTNAITMGIGTILRSKKIVLLATSDKLKAAGIDVIIAEYQAQLDNYKASKK